MQAFAQKRESPLNDAQRAAGCILHLEALKKPTEWMVSEQDLSSIRIEEVNVEGAPVPQKLSPDEAEKASLLFGRVGDFLSEFIADAVLVAAFKTDDFRWFEDLLDEELLVTDERSECVLHGGVSLGARSTGCNQI